MKCSSPIPDPGPRPEMESCKATGKMRLTQHRENCLSTTLVSRYKLTQGLKRAISTECYVNLDPLLCLQMDYVKRDLKPLQDKNFMLLTPSVGKRFP